VFSMVSAGLNGMPSKCLRLRARHCIGGRPLARRESRPKRIGFRKAMAAGNGRSLQE
jgi:hypothetical protein